MTDATLTLLVVDDEPAWVGALGAVLGKAGHRIVAAYDASPPEYVVLVAWSGAEYGVGTFGSPEWGRELVDWVARRYERIESVPSTPTSIGFSMWRLRSVGYATRTGGSG